MASVQVRDVSKYFKHYRSEAGRLVEWASAGRMCRHERRSVLRDVSFAVEPGEALAIVGRNGAGKSTLLRIINGTLRPSAGRIERKGRTAALELGLRFHDDLSGRQNLLMAGQLLGLSAKQLEARLPEIEDFSELSRELDDPVRTYSSGMRLRLAFSIATAQRPDILLVDEALAVGDVRFQQKCLARIKGFLAQGTCMVLVSHDLNAIGAFCNRAVLLERGQLLRSGSPHDVLDYYNALLAKLDDDYRIQQEQRSRALVHETRSGQGQASIEEVELLSAGAPSRAFDVGSQVTIRVAGRANEAIASLTVGFAIRDRLGQDVFGTNSHHLSDQVVQLHAGERFVAEFELSAHLGPDEYTLTVALHTGRVHVEGNYDWWDQALTFQVLPGQLPYFDGIAHLPTKMHLRCLSVEESADPVAASESTE